METKNLSEISNQYELVNFNDKQFHEPEGETNQETNEVHQIKQVGVEKDGIKSNKIKDICHINWKKVAILSQIAFNLMVTTLLILVFTKQPELYKSGIEIFNNIPGESIRDNSVSNQKIISITSSKISTSIPDSLIQSIDATKIIGNIPGNQISGGISYNSIINKPSSITGIESYFNVLTGSNSGSNTISFNRYSNTFTGQNTFTMFQPQDHNICEIFSIFYCTGPGGDVRKTICQRISGIGGSCLTVYQGLTCPDYNYNFLFHEDGLKFENIFVGVNALVSAQIVCYKA